MLKELTIVVAMGAVAGVLISPAAVRLASGECKYGCKEYAAFIFKSSNPASKDCHVYNPDQAHVGLMDDPDGIKQSVPGSTLSHHRCPTGYCDPICTPVVHSVFTQSNHAGVDENCDQMAAVPGHICYVNPNS